MDIIAVAYDRCDDEIIELSEPVAIGNLRHLHEQCRAWLVAMGQSGSLIVYCKKCVANGVSLKTSFFILENCDKKKQTKR